MLRQGGSIVEYGLKLKASMAAERKIKVSELVLRCMICGLGVLSTALIVSASEVRVIFTVEKRAKFSDMNSLVVLVIANGIAAGFNLLQGARCTISMVKGSVLLSKGIACLIFFCDQVMAYITLASLAAAMQSGVISKFGLEEMQWMKLCNLYEKYCGEVGQGVAGATLVSISMILVSFMSAYNLFRLYH